MARKRTRIMGQSEPAVRSAVESSLHRRTQARAEDFETIRRPSLDPRQREVLRMQQTMGNQAVQRMMVQRQPAGKDFAPPEAQAGADSSVAAPAPVQVEGCPTHPGNDDLRAIHDTLCLLSQDLTGDTRLNDAFHNNPPLTAKDNGEPVQKMQQALLDMHEDLTNFGADGKWGDETTRAVASFQSKKGIQPGGFEAGRKTLLALDTQLQLNPPKPSPLPPQPLPPQPVPPQPTPPTPVFNPELEDTMDAILNTMMFILTARRDGLDQLLPELRKSDVVEERKDLDKIGDMTKDGVGDGLNFAVGKLVEKLSDGIAGLLTAYVSFVISGTLTEDINFAKKAVTPAESSKDATFSLAEFFYNAQKKSLTDHSFQVQQAYLTEPGAPEVEHTKPQLRAMEQQNPGVGLNAARYDLNKLRAQQQSGQDEQYKASLSAWAIIQAHLSLGEAYRGDDTKTSPGTNLSNPKSDAKGVLEAVFGEKYKFYSDQPLQQTPRLLFDVSKDVRVPGLNANLLAALKKRSSTLGDTKIPIIARAEIAFITMENNEEKSSKNVVALLGLNEMGNVFLKYLDNPEQAAHYFKLRAANGNETQAKAGGAKMVYEGVKTALNEDVGPKTIDDLTLKNEELDVD